MGIDVYHGTGPVDWAQVKAAGHSFAFIKATEGVSLIDANLAHNLVGMKAAGMIRGCYHFYHVGLNPIVQANHFLNAVRAAGFDPAKELPLALDLEDRAGATQYGYEKMRTDVSAFLSHVQQWGGGRFPVIYLDTDFGQNILGEGYGGHPLWLAQYTQGTAPHVIPSGWATTGWKFWQYSESGRLPGISGNVVDLDKWNGDEASLRQWIASPA